MQIYCKFVMFKIMYLMPVEGQCGRNKYHVLTGTIKFVVTGSRSCVSFNVMYHKEMNCTQKKCNCCTLSLTSVLEEGGWKLNHGKHNNQ
jgi:hypothetical protein